MATPQREEVRIQSGMSERQREAGGKVLMGKGEAEHAADAVASYWPGLSVAPPPPPPPPPPRLLIQP